MASQLFVVFNTLLLPTYENTSASATPSASATMTPSTTVSWISAAIDRASKTATINRTTIIPIAIGECAAGTSDPNCKAASSAVISTAVISTAISTAMSTVVAMLGHRILA
jgi:hypothetical protein